MLLILIILIQKPQGGGLSGAFGGGAAQGSGQTVFGARTGDALTIGTISVFVLYLLVAIGLNYAIRPHGPGAVVPVAGAAGAQTTTETAPVAGQDTAPVNTPVNAPANAPAQPEPQP